MASDDLHGQPQEEKTSELIPAKVVEDLAAETKQLEHRIKTESKLVHSEIRLNYLGLFSGFIIAILGLSGAVYLGANDKTVSSGVLSVGTLASLVSVFVSGKSSVKKQSTSENDSDEGGDNGEKRAPSSSNS